MKKIQKSLISVLTKQPKRGCKQPQNGCKQEVLKVGNFLPFKLRKSSK